MNKKIFWIIPIVLTLIVAGNPFLAHYLRQRETLRIVKAILSHWQKEEILDVFTYWEDQTKTPPIYNLLSYKINKKVYDRKDGRHEAKIFITLEFPSGHVLPSGKEWVFALRKTKLGWKVIDFYPVDQSRPTEGISKNE